MNGSAEPTERPRAMRFYGPRRLTVAWRDLVAGRLLAEGSPVVAIASHREKAAFDGSGLTHSFDVSLTTRQCLELSETWVREGWNTRMVFGFPKP